MCFVHASDLGIGLLFLAMVDESEAGDMFFIFFVFFPSPCPILTRYPGVAANVCRHDASDGAGTDCAIVKITPLFRDFYNGRIRVPSLMLRH
jgi:hypothetical protein